MLRFQLIVCLLLSLLLVACGSDSETSEGGYGSIVFRAVWPASGVQSASFSTGTMPAEVQTVRMIVTGSGMSPMRQDFAASAHTGTISGIPVGTNRTLTLQALGVGGGILFEGNKTGLVLVKDVPTNAGEVLMVKIITPAPVAKTGKTTTHVVGDDGTLQPGVAWPSPRFTDNANGTVTDNLTGLIWLKNANCFGSMQWADALTSANTLSSGVCGLTDGSMAGDWRLPSRRELWSLIDFGGNSPALSDGHPFTGVQTGDYWSSSSYANTPTVAWVVRMGNGYVLSGGKAGYYIVWPVRGGQ